MKLPTPIDPGLAAQFALRAKAQQLAQSAETKGDGPANAKIEKAAQEFEAIFLNIMLREMRKTVGDGGIFGDDAGTKIYQEMMDSALAEAMAKSKMFGLGRVVAEQMREHSS